MLRSPNPLTILLSLLLMSACGTEPPPSGLTVQDAWIREAPPNAMMLAGYMVVTNNDTQPHTLISAHSEAFGEIEFHRSFEVDGVARMEMQPRLVVPAQGSISLEPGSYHMMLMQPTTPLSSGSVVTITLRVDNGKEISIDVPVRKPGQ